VYIDSNIFISSLIYERSGKATNTKRVLASVEKGEVAAYTSTLTWDEVVWVVRRVLGRADSIQAGAKLADYPNLRFVSTSEEIIRSAQRLLSEYPLAPRDAIHVASALSRPVDSLVSDDSELDVVREVKREASEVFEPERSVKSSD
jgi:predicted nucleic acid-binding protein